MSQTVGFPVHRWPACVQVLKKILNHVTPVYRFECCAQGFVVMGSFRRILDIHVRSLLKVRIDGSPCFRPASRVAVINETWRVGSPLSIVKRCMVLLGRRAVSKGSARSERQRHTVVEPLVYWRKNKINKIEQKPLLFTAYSSPARTPPPTVHEGLMKMLTGFIGSNQHLSLMLAPQRIRVDPDSQPGRSCLSRHCA